MNGFIDEVCTQGTLLKTCLNYYLTEEMNQLEKIVARFREGQMEKVVLSGMGSSLYAMDSVKSYLIGHGIPAFCCNSFELSRYQFGLIDRRTLVVLVSQSGKSAEVVELAEKAGKVALTVAIHNAPGCPLEELCDYSLNLNAGKEYSITSKTYELTMLLLNILVRKLTDSLTDDFLLECETLSVWVEEWLKNWEENSKAMYEFAKDTLLFDLLADHTSLATARQLSLAYREGLHNCTAIWESADYAHGQYHSSKLGKTYLAQMFFPVWDYESKAEKMRRYILDHGGKVMVYTSSDLHEEERMFVVKLPRFHDSLMPLAESIAAETVLGMLFGPDWIKDH